NDQVLKVLVDERIQDVKAILGCNITFRLTTDISPVTEDAGVVSVAEKWSGTKFIFDEDSSLSKTGVCLVSGENSVISRLHRPISGINKKPSPMLAVNDTESPAFSSFGK